MSPKDLCDNIIPDVKYFMTFLSAGAAEPSDSSLSHGLDMIAEDTIAGIVIATSPG